MYSAPVWVAAGIALLGVAQVRRWRAQILGDVDVVREVRAADILLLPGLAQVIVGLALAAPSELPAESEDPSHASASAKRNVVLAKSLPKKVRVKHRGGCESEEGLRRPGQLAGADHWVSGRVTAKRRERR